MILMEREDTENWHRKYYITLCGEHAVERLWTCHKAGYEMYELKYSEVKSQKWSEKFSNVKCSEVK